MSAIITALLATGGKIVPILLGMGSRLLTAKVVEKVVIMLVEQLVKRTASKVDDQVLAVFKQELTK